MWLPFFALGKAILADGISLTARRTLCNFPA